MHVVFFIVILGKKCVKESTIITALMFFTDAVIFIELEVHLRGSTIQNAAYGVALYYCLQKFYCHCIVVYSTV